MIGPQSKKLLLDAEACRRSRNCCGGVAKILRSRQRDGRSVRHIGGRRTCCPGLRSVRAREKRANLRELRKIAGSFLHRLPQSCANACDSGRHPPQRRVAYCCDRNAEIAEDTELA